MESNHSHLIQLSGVLPSRTQSSHRLAIELLGLANSKHCYTVARMGFEPTISSAIITGGNAHFPTLQSPQRLYNIHGTMDSLRERIKRTPNGTRTRVTALRGRGNKPLYDGDISITILLSTNMLTKYILSCNFINVKLIPYLKESPPNGI